MGYILISVVIVVAALWIYSIFLKKIISSAIVNAFSQIQAKSKAQIEFEKEQEHTLSGDEMDEIIDRLGKSNS